MVRKINWRWVFDKQHQLFMFPVHLTLLLIIPTLVVIAPIVLAHYPNGFGFSEGGLLNGAIFPFIGLAIGIFLIIAVITYLIVTLFANRSQPEPKSNILGPHNSDVGFCGVEDHGQT